MLNTHDLGLSKSAMSPMVTDEKDRHYSEISSLLHTFHVTSMVKSPTLPYDGCVRVFKDSSLMHIVCVEDDKSLRSVVVETLQYLAPDVTIDVFGSSDDLLSTLNPAKIDLVLLDVRIPGTLNGAGLAKYLRDLGYVGVMALMSAYPRLPADILDPIKCEWLSKPIDVDTLDGLVTKAHTQPPRY